MRDGASGRSRGFGFLTFRDPKVVNTVMVKEHFLDGKIVSFVTTPATVWSLTSSRLTLSVRYPEKNKREQQKSSLVV
jgi:hypothetical protein